MQDDPEEYMLRLGGEMMSDADSPRAAALALNMALVERGGPPTAAAVLALGPQIPVRPCTLAPGPPSRRHAWLGPPCFCAWVFGPPTGCHACM